jgi:hypothetical protein
MSDGGIAIAETLKYNDKLMTLNLSHNQILDEGAKAIGRLLAWNSNLRQ